MTTPIKLAPRKLAFDFSDVPALHHRDNAYLSHFWNALSIMAPTTERLAIRVLRNARKKVSDPQLVDDIDAFLAQEGLHTREHRRFNRRLAELGYDPSEAVAAADRTADAYLDQADEPSAIALVIAGEHIIYALCRVLLTEDALEGMHPEVRRLFEWHALEEMEHQSVAHDVYVHLYGDGPVHRLRRARALRDGFRILSGMSRDISKALLGGQPRPSRAELRDFLRFMTLSPGYGLRVLALSFKFLLPSYAPWRNPHDIPMIHATLDRLDLAA